MPQTIGFYNEKCSTAAPQQKKGVDQQTLPGRFSTRPVEPLESKTVWAQGALKKVASLQAQGAQGAFGPLEKVASLRAQGAFGPLKKVASLRDPCPESTKMVGYTFYFMPGKAQNWRLRRPFWEFLGMK